MSVGNKTVLPLFAVLSFFLAYFLVRNLIQVPKTFQDLPTISPQEKNLDKVSIGSTEILVEIVNTDETRSHGLSGRKSLPGDQGLLFVWENEVYPGFWMKDMNFAIDIIWISDSKIVGIEKNIQPEADKPDSQLTIYYPPNPITHALEVNAGFNDENDIKVGDVVKLP